MKRIATPSKQGQISRDKLQNERRAPCKYLLEVEVFEGEMHFYDAGGFDSGPQNVLLGGLVVFGTQPLQVIQETGGQGQGQVRVGSRTRLRYESRKASGTK